MTVEDINYSDGVGFGHLTLRVNGIEAESMLSSSEEGDSAAASEQNESESATGSEETSTSGEGQVGGGDAILLSGIVTVTVKDLSSGGLSSTFEINVSILKAIQEDQQSDEDTEESSQSDQ